MTPFIGRKQELAGLEELLKKKSASLVVISGRRRIGKSRLAEEFGRSFSKTYIFAGLPPTAGVTANDQKNEFIRQMREYAIPRLGGNDWGDLFKDLSEKCRRGRLLIVLDEISWMGKGDTTFLGKLKNAWDQHFKKNPQLILMISGSQSTWIEKNILNSSGFVGRISYQLSLEELALWECNQFWNPKEHLVSPYEKLKLLAVTGGVPRYLEEIQVSSPAEENIKRLCFRPEGLLFHEFEQIFSDLFSRRSKKYKMIVTLLAQRDTTMEEITQALGRAKGGDVSGYLEDLCKTGFVTRDFTWNIKDAQISRLSRYRLSDNYVRFYLKFIAPNRQKILSGVGGLLPPAWLSILGLQFENLVLSKKNRLRVFDCLGIPPHEIVLSNRFFQTKTRSRRGCQVDFMVQTKFNTLYVCEIKFSHQKIGGEIVAELREKIDRLEMARNFSVRPVLIHVNGVSPAVGESDFFSHIIDFGDLLKPA